MQITMLGTLLGVVGKKGSGKLDNGQEWSTDRVELHVLTPFNVDDSMAHGSTVTVYNVADYSRHYEKAKSCLQQQINLIMEMQPAKKLGAAPKFVCLDFEAAVPVSLPNKKTSTSTGEQVLSLDPIESKVPDGVKKF